MGTEVLRPQDLIISQTRSFHSKNNKAKKKAKKSSLLNGDVTLLKRGEPLDSVIVTKSKFASLPNPNLGPISVIVNADRIGPESPLIVVPKQIRLPAPHKMYAGSVITTSPSPRALPKPSFCRNNYKEDDFATRDLRRLLRLD